MKEREKILSRRNFLELMALAGVGGAGALSLNVPSLTGKESPENLSLKNLRNDAFREEKISLHVFSKHLQFLNYNQMAEVAAEAGFDGVDLAVRPNGSVLPEKVQEDLPRATAAIRSQGLKTLMMTTAVNDAGDDTQQKLIKTAAEAGIKYYRTDWLWYDEKLEVKENLKVFGRRLEALAQLNAQNNIIGDYQNHAGFNGYPFGGPVWDLALVLQELQNPFIGCQYDIRHASVEGGTSWPLGLKYIQPHIHTLVVKDFKWEKINNQWQVINTPIGEGMVDFPKFFSLLKEYGINAPVSVHFEYEMPEHHKNLTEQEKRRQTITIMRKDTDALRKYMNEAGL